MKKLFFLIIFFCVTCLFADEDISQLPPPYNQVHLMSYNLQGWYADCNRHAIKNFIKTRNIMTIVEVGSWLGLSTHHMAKLLPQGGKVYAIDTWEGSPEHQGNPILDTLYDQFLSNVIHAHLTDKIIPVRMDSITASQTLNVIADLIYIDANHSYECCYADCNAWFSHVKSRGILCGDDWGWPGVKQAVQQFTQENNLQVHVEGEVFWWLIKP